MSDVSGAINIAQFSFAFISMWPTKHYIEQRKYGDAAFWAMLFLANLVGAFA